MKDDYLIWGYNKEMVEENRSLQILLMGRVGREFFSYAIKPRADVTLLI